MHTSVATVEAENKGRLAPPVPMQPQSVATDPSPLLAKFLTELLHRNKLNMPQYHAVIRMVGSVEGLVANSFMTVRRCVFGVRAHQEITDRMDRIHAAFPELKQSLPDTSGLFEGEHAAMQERWAIYVASSIIAAHDSRVKGVLCPKKKS